VRPYIRTDAIANEVLAKAPYRLSNEFAIDVEKAIRLYCCFDVAYIPNFCLGKRKLLGAYFPDLRMIAVEAKDNRGRQRFSLAHELGHALIDYRAGDLALFESSRCAFFRCDDSDVSESEAVTQSPEATELELRRVRRRPLSEILANQFASHFLMPERLVRDLWRADPDILRSAEKLAVSREAFGIRLKTLGLAKTAGA